MALKSRAALAPRPQQPPLLDRLDGDRCPLCARVLAAGVCVHCDNRRCETCAGLTGRACLRQCVVCKPARTWAAYRAEVFGTQVAALRRFRLHRATEANGDAV